VGFAAGEVRVRVSTLMHLDDLPGELAGWGPVHAELARRLVKRQIGGEWRFAVCDEEGRLVWAGITRHRPIGWPRRAATGPVRPRGIVELQIPLALLRAWNGERTPLDGWTRVIDDITRQLDDDMRLPGQDTDGSAPPSGVQPPGGKPPGARADERRRFATVGLRRWVQIRDRVCSHPGCRAPATRAELDHTYSYAEGGTTEEGNLAAACAHDHDLRENGWRVVQITPGHVEWISRTGHRYPVAPPPIIEPLPEPLLLGSLPGAGDANSEIEADLPLPGDWDHGPPWLEANQPGALGLPGQSRVEPDPTPQHQPGSHPQESPQCKPAPLSEWDEPPF
jgi:hypothetical protein